MGSKSWVMLGKSRGLARNRPIIPSNPSKNSSAQHSVVSSTALWLSPQFLSLALKARLAPAISAADKTPAHAMYGGWRHSGTHTDQ